MTSQSGHNGVISVTFTKACAIAVVKSLVGEIEDVVQDVQDAVGELTNMISGQARAQLSEQGMSLRASTPSVVIGRGHTVEHVATAPILSIPFSTEHGALVVEVCFTDAEEAGQTAA